MSQRGRNAHELARNLWNLRMPRDPRRERASIQAAQDRPVIPSDERIAIESLWAVEFYSSAQTEQLMARLRRLGGESEGNGFGRPPSSAWLRDSRHRPGSWRTIGKLVTDSRNTNAETFVTVLPCGVRHAHAFLAVVTPSLTALSVHFIFDEEAKRQFQNALQRPQQTRSRKTRDGWQHQGPVARRLDDVLAIRRNLVKLAASWFAEHVPGLFCGGQLGGNPPTCELLTFRETEPVPVEPVESSIAHECLCILGMRWGSTAWVAASNPDIKFNLSHQIFIRPDSHCVLTCRESSMKGESPFADPHTAPAMLCAAGTMLLVARYADMSRRLRDAVIFHARPSRVMSALRSLTASDSTQLAPALDELSSTAVQRASPFGRFIRLDPHRNNREAVPLDDLSKGVVQAAAKSQRAANRQLMAELTQLCALLLQMRIGRLTVVMVVLAIVTALVAIPQFVDWIRSLLTAIDG